MDQETMQTPADTPSATPEPSTSSSPAYENPYAYEPTAPADSAPVASALSAPPVPPFLADSKDTVMALVVLLLGVCIGEMVMFVGGLGVGITAITVLTYIAVMIYGTVTGRANLAAGPELYLCNLLLAASFTLLDPGQMGFMRLVLLMLLNSLHFMSLFGVRTAPRYTFRGLMVDGIGGTLYNGIANPDKSIRVFRATRGNRFFGTVVRQVLLGLIIAVPLLAILILLLRSADEAFAKEVETLFETLGMRFWEHVGRVLLGLVIGLFFFGYVYRLRYNDRLIRPVPPMSRWMPQTVVYTVLVAVCTLYVLFLCIAGNYLFSGLAGRLPESFSYASYARRGFFELLAVALINMAILLFTFLYTQRGEGDRPRGVLRVLLSVLVLETWLLIASALSKMVMYIGEYGLTRLRVYTSWFMLLLALVFLAAMVQLWWRRFPGFKVTLITGVVWFLLLNLANTDGLIARYNVEAYQSGKLADMDVAMFEELSDAMVGPAAELLSDKDPQVAAKAAYMLKERQMQWEDQRLGSWNLTTYRAQMRLQKQAADVEAGYTQYKYANWEDCGALDDEELTKSVALTMELYADNVTSVTLHYGTGNDALGSETVQPVFDVAEDYYTYGRELYLYVYLPREACQDGWWYIQPELTTADGETFRLPTYDFMDDGGDLRLSTEVVCHPEYDEIYWRQIGQSGIII